jgi:hypothetical protein
MDTTSQRACSPRQRRVRTEVLVQSGLDRFLALVRQELGAEEACVLEADEETPEDPCQLHCRMTDGRGLRVRFASPPHDHELKQRRLEMLVSTFNAVVEEDKSSRRSSRPPVMQALRDELEALCERAGSVNAIVIDANSPVEWGAAQPQEAIPLDSRASSIPAPATDARENPSSEPGAAGNRLPASMGRARNSTVSRRALRTVRALPELAALRKGKHVRYVERLTEAPLIAHSFAGIYLLVLVFDAPFDELRTERAILEALPRIERLVLALPPLDPAPNAGVVALRRPRRR